MADRRNRIMKRAEQKGWLGKLVKFSFNCTSGLYRRTGGKLEYVSNDLREIRVKIPLNRKTKNYVGTIFGGSQFSACDPIYMFQLIYLLGNDYVVWDKSTNIVFKKPGKSTLRYNFIITEDLLHSIKHAISEEGSYTFQLPIDLTDEDGDIVSSATKTMYAASKEYYRTRRRNR